jgi:Major Facilitator Superfamily
MGWTNPLVLAGLGGGSALLAAFAILETRIEAPMFQLSLFRIRAFTAGNLAGLAVAIARGGLQFMLIIWLQGIWLPLHGYDYSQTPLWAGIFLLPLTAGFLVSGPVAGWLSDKFGSRGIATAGMAVFGGSFIGLMLLPVSFPYPAFALLIALNGIGSGMFASPNSSSIIGSVPARQRGPADPHRPGVLPRPHLRPVPARPGHRVRPGRGPVRPRRPGVGPARLPPRPRPAGRNSAGRNSAGRNSAGRNSASRNSASRNSAGRIS